MSSATTFSWPCCRATARGVKPSWGRGQWAEEKQRREKMKRRLIKGRTTFLSLKIDCNYFFVGLLQWKLCNTPIQVCTLIGDRKGRPKQNEMRAGIIKGEGMLETMWFHIVWAVPELHVISSCPTISVCSINSKHLICSYLFPIVNCNYMIPQCLLTIIVLLLLIKEIKIQRLRYR